MKKNRENRNKKILRNKRIKTSVIIGVIVAVVAMGIGFALTTLKSQSTIANAAAPIDGIKCESMEQSNFHIHAHLDIFINGQPYAVPPKIGITDRCLYWLHTHDNTGIIHIESPLKRDYTLGQFFDIWDKKFDNSRIFDNAVGGTNALNVYINGTKISDGTNYRDIVFHAHDVVSIVYGKPTPSKIPSNYDFIPGE